MTNMIHSIIIGSGFSGLAAATSLADQGHKVIILEKNATPGGRARRFEAEGFTFDMGPSWYWMPEVFEDYFQKFGKQVSDYYELDRLDPSYRVYFSTEDSIDVPARMDATYALFDKIEAGSADKLRSFMEEAAYKYKIGMEEFVWKPSLSVMEFVDLRILKSAMRLQMFSSISSHVRKLFKDERLRQILEFPVLFLGAKPQDTPALYSLMNHADLQLGTWYPKGGMYQIVEAMVSLAKAKGVKFLYNQEVVGVEVEQNVVKKVHTTDQSYEADVIVSSADYAHTDQVILKDHAQYSWSYWDSRVMAPSSMLYYIGLNQKIPELEHHNLFFDEDFDLHSKQIYETIEYPDDPLMYVSVVSKSDPAAAPDGCENLFVLIPIAAGMKEDPSRRDYYFDYAISKLEKYTGRKLKDSIIYKRSYAQKEFIEDYHAHKGNAYGLANTLKQTAILKPRIKHKRLKNFYYTGQLSCPGPGVPPSLISGQLVAGEVLKRFR